MSELVEIPAVNTLPVKQEILLESGLDDHSVPRTKLIELSQVSLLKSQNMHFTIFDDHFLSIYIKTIFSKPKSYRIDLAYLEPEPRRILTIDRPSLYAAGILSLAALLSISIHEFFYPSPTLLLIAVALTCGALVTLMMLVYRSKDRLVFYSRYGRINWLELMINHPSQRDFKAFTARLVSTIHAVSRHQSSRHEQRLAAELREQRRLRDEGVLPPETYERVKRQFFSQHVQLRNVYTEAKTAPMPRTEMSRSNVSNVSRHVLTTLSNRMTSLRQQMKSRKSRNDTRPAA